MTQEDKKLLLKDLCARLPYGVILNVIDIDGFTFEGELRVINKGWCKLHISDPKKRARVKNEIIPLNHIYIKPYLRPMSSMTEEEYNELDVLAYGCDCILHTSCFPVRCNAKFKTYNLEVIDWLNAHHFDYRGLIDKCLAIEAPEGMYK